MGVVDIIVIVLVGLFVLSRFFAFRLPKDPRSRSLRKADFARMFQRHIPAEPKGDVGVQAAPKGRKAAAPMVKKVSAKDLEGLSGVEKIKAMDPGFTEKKFIEGARTAYGYFYKCWNAKDEDGLMNLCAPRLVDEIVGGWGRAWHKVEVEQVGEVEIGDARVSGRTAIVEAVITARRKEGKATKTVKSVWLLARAMGSDDPNWELQTMREARA